MLNAKPSTREYAAAAFHNIAFTGGDNRATIAQTKGTVRGLVVLLGEGVTENSKLQAAAALSATVMVSSTRVAPNMPLNIVEADHEAQSEAARAGGLSVLIHLLNDTVVGFTTKEQSVLALRALVHHNPANLAALARGPGLPLLVGQLRNGASSSQWHAAWILQAVTKQNAEMRAEVADALGCDVCEVEVALKFQFGAPSPQASPAIGMGKGHARLTTMVGSREVH